MVPDVTVFNTAWLIEKDLSEFYEKMANQVEGKAQEALRMLSEWEKGHERFFRKYRDKLTEVYSKMPWGGVSLSPSPPISHPEQGNPALGPLSSHPLFSY
jgi:hypothetical protein